MEKKIYLGESKNGKIKLLHELSNEQINLYNKSAKELVEVNKSSWPFLIVKQNYFLFMEETLADFKNINFVKEVPWEIMQEITIQSNRRLYNFIGSFASYVDHTKTYIARKFGKNSAELDAFIKATNFHFGNTFGYRFLCKLRDYTLHCGMPMGNISATATLNEKKVYENTVTLKFGRDELLQKFPSKKWGKIVGPELQKMDEFFSVSNLVYDTMDCIEKMNKILIKFNHLLIIEATEKIIKALELNTDWTKEYFRLITKDENSDENLLISQIPFHLMQTNP
jgi:hypothetical protein